MHTTGLKLFFYEIGHSLGLVSNEELEAAREAHLENLNAPMPDCEYYRDVYTEGRGSYRECVSYPASLSSRASLWK